MCTTLKSLRVKESYFTFYVPLLTTSLADESSFHDVPSVVRDHAGLVHRRHNQRAEGGGNAGQVELGDEHLGGGGAGEMSFGLKDAA